MATLSQATRISLLAVAAILCLTLPAAHSFSTQKLQRIATVSTRTPTSLLVLSVAESDVEEDVQIPWSEEDIYDKDDDDDDDDDHPDKKSNGKRWENLNGKYKQYLIQKGQQKAIDNKKKREPTMDKKRKVLMFMKEQQKQKKKDSKVQRPISFGNRTAIADLVIGSSHEGTVISLTSFGAYVDVGSEVDGLLHISQISVDAFVEHPRQVLTPGDTVTVRVRSSNPDKQKLHLTMLPEEVVQAEVEELASIEDRIPLDDIQVDDELWGQIKRVTDFGAYIEVGAVADGWLHFMDHPTWDGEMVPSDFMERGDRVRVWVSDMDRDQKRLKLTANRPTHLPGPRRELF